MWFCRHDWIVILDRLLEAPIRAGPGFEAKGCPADLLLQDAVLVILQCRKCGKLDKTFKRRTN